jgi:hypothetical protein
MYKKIASTGQNQCFSVQKQYTKRQKDKKTISSKNNPDKIIKSIDLSATKVRAFCQKLLPFWINLFSFLLF